MTTGRARIVYINAGAEQCMDIARLFVDLAVDLGACPVVKRAKKAPANA